MEIFNRVSEKFCSNEPIQAQELINESECDAEEDNYLKSTSTNRAHTDVPFLVLHGVFLAILAIVLGYSIINGDIDRLTKGFDKCGNVCGKNNNFHIQSQIDCKAQDMTNKPFLYIDGDRRECVENCGNGTAENGVYQCNSNQVKADKEHDIEAFINGFARSLYKCSYEIILLSVIAIGFAFVMLVMMRYMAAVFIWFLLLAMLMVLTGAAAFCGNLAATTESVNERDSDIRATIFYSIFALVMFLIIIVMRRRIELLVQLLKEAGKSIMMMPLLLVQPLLTFISLAIIWSAWFYFSLWIESAGTPDELFGKVTFVPTAFMCLADLYNTFMMLWMVQFVCGCQNMLVAGAVSTWYFARDKCRLGRPIQNSAKNLVKYHLGTVSVTSLIIALLQFVRLLILTLRRTLRFAVCITYCLNYVEQWMRYYTKNSCIITAMHGYPFCRAGSRAFKLIMGNILQIVAINSLADFLLVLAKLLVTASTIAVGHVMIRNKSITDYELPILILVGLMAYMISHSVFSIYETAIDTIFICFCEDREVNGPYFMSSELMEFVEKSKILLKVNDNQKGSAKAAVTI